jgi:hypothetical protein
MATTTTNFGWDIPQSTDLVKDGATAIAALGQDIDTALVDLKGGTTGQVLAKASNTDLDYSWVAQDDSNAIQNAIVDAKGDLIGATAADTPARLAVGTNGQVLTADSTAATGLAWATVSTTPTYVGTNVYNSTTLNISSGTQTAVTWDTELFDTNAIHSTSTNTSRFTVPTGKGGYWQISPIINWNDTSSAGVRQLKVYKNGVVAKSSHFYPTSAGTMVANYTFTINLSAADYVEIYVFQNSGSTIGIYGNAADTLMSNCSFDYLGA